MKKFGEAKKALKAGYKREYVAMTDATVDRLLIELFGQIVIVHEFYLESLYDTGSMEGARLVDFLYHYGMINRENRDKIRLFKNYRNFMLHNLWGGITIARSKDRELRNSLVKEIKKEYCRGLGMQVEQNSVAIKHDVEAEAYAKYQKDISIKSEEIITYLYDRIVRFERERLLCLETEEKTK